MLKRLDILALCVVAALLQIHLLQIGSGNIENNLPDWINTVWKQGPNWPGYHTRLLGVATFMLLGGTMSAFMLACDVALTVAGLLAWRLNGVAGLAILHAAFAVLANPWFEPWDMWEPAIFLGFVILVVERKPWYWFVGLFSIAIFNLQTAMWIPLWMVLSRKMVLAGLLCGVCGIGVMYYFQHSNHPWLGFSTFQCMDKSEGYETDYAQIRVVENIRKLFDLRIGGTFAVFAVAGYSILKDELALGLTYLSLLLATLVFGIVDEQRVFLPFIPLLMVASREVP